MASSEGYKIKLASGRVLGPLDMERIRKLILKKQITGVELVRDPFAPDWKHISLFPDLAAMLIAHAEGRLQKEELENKTQKLSHRPFGANPGPTEVLSGARTAQSLELESISLPEELPPVPSGAENVPNISADEIMSIDVDGEKGPPEFKVEEVVEKTLISDPEHPDEDDEKTQMVSPEELSLRPPTPEEEKALEEEAPSLSGMSHIHFKPPLQKRNVSEEQTIVFQGVRKVPEFLRSAGKKKSGKRDLKETIMAVAAAICLGMAGYEIFLAGPENVPISARVIRPRLPSYIQGKSDPTKSQGVYNEGLKFYLQDNVLGYKVAAEKFQIAASLDIGNVRALAMLASTYLNLIDSSNKDENYFSTISKLIDMSRAKAMDLPETVIADVEYFITVNKAEAAENRIIEYTKSHAKFGLEMFYYVALALYHRGDANMAARYMAQFPDNKAFSPKIFYLKGGIAEKLNDPESAMKEYNKALAFNKSHVKSRLRIAEILKNSGNLKAAEDHLDFIVNNAQLLASKNLAQGYFLHALLSEQRQRWDAAIFDIERAVRLDRENHDYLLELYTLRARQGDKSGAVQRVARMYYFLGEGEKNIKEGKYTEALNDFLQARREDNESPYPLVKIGDMFQYLRDHKNAQINYKLAAQRAPNSVEIWSKYMAVLIESFEWTEAQKAMDRFRSLPVNQSAIDKAAADLYEKQGMSDKAQVYYRKAMSRDVIDPDVYIAYAKSLMSTKNFKDAPFFFALALRRDPLNLDAIIGTAKCIAATESIDKAVLMLQDELQKRNGSKAELLSAIAEFQIQKGAWDQAQENVRQAMSASPDYGMPWKLQAQIYMNREGSDKAALEKALNAYKSYSDRSPSDPSGYLERYKIFIRRTEFDKASEELNKIYGVFPKYPLLHYYKGALYSVMQNRKTAVEEFKIELQNNPNSVGTMLALGKEYLEMGAANDALNLFIKAMQLAPASSEPKHWAGWANYHLKNYPAAIALFQSALQIDRANAIIYKRLGLAYREMGAANEASDAFRRYLEIEPDAPDRGEFDKYR